jgi:hypothetical protein
MHPNPLVPLLYPLSCISDTHILEDVQMPQEVEKELEEKLADLYAPLHSRLATLDAQERVLARSLVILWFGDV